MMIDREKVIKAIEYCTDDDLPCRDDSCPYWPEGFSACLGNLMRDALALLKADQTYLLEKDKTIKKLQQEPRVIA